MLVNKLIIDQLMKTLSVVECSILTFIRGRSWLVNSPRGIIFNQSERSSYFTHTWLYKFLFWVMAMEEKFSGKDITYFLQKLNTSWMIIDETLWSRDIKFSQSQLFWFCSSPFYPILSSHDCNPENWASNSTILFLVYKHRTKKFARIFKNITSEALCGRSSVFNQLKYTLRGENLLRRDWIIELGSPRSADSSSICFCFLFFNAMAWRQQIQLSDKNLQTLLKFSLKV